MSLFFAEQETGLRSSINISKLHSWLAAESRQGAKFHLSIQHVLINFYSAFGMSTLSTNRGDGFQEDCVHSWMMAKGSDLGCTMMPGLRCIRRGWDEGCF